MTRGRKPDQPELKIAKGNPGKRKVVGHAAQSPAGSLKAPSKLGRAAQAVWRELASELERMNFLRPTDRQSFARYCHYLTRWWDVTSRLKSGDETYDTETPHGKMKRINPLFVVQERMDKRLEAYEDRFGLSPAARQQIMQRLATAAPTLPLDQPKQPDRGAEMKQPESPIGFLGGSGPLH